MQSELVFYPSVGVLLILLVLLMDELFALLSAVKDGEVTEAEAI